MKGLMLNFLYERDRWSCLHLAHSLQASGTFAYVEPANGWSNVDRIVVSIASKTSSRGMS